MPAGGRNVVQYTQDAIPGSKSSEPCTRKKTVTKKPRSRNQKIDPVQIAFIQELKRFTGYVDRIQKEADLYAEKTEEESPARLSNTLFSLWNNYFTKLPSKYFAGKLISTGDYLFKVKEYSVARQHCYGYFLRLMREKATSTDYCEVFFPNGFKETDDVIETSQAIFGNGLCTLKILQERDPFLSEEKTVRELLEVLNDFRTLTQHLIPHERFCWLVFNGTVHMYQIGKLLVDRGHTASTLEFMVWCCVCLESVIPLMTLRFLSWRGTLYSAVCECYLDLNQAHAAEMFARRALQKIHQLAKIEEQSLSEATPESEAIFREVTVKLSAMIFKRIVFESRRPKKIIHRPKTRQNLKELQMLPFPRTTTEKLVLDMFEGSASQFYAILEALADPSRRICQSAPPPLDTTEGGDMLMDVWGELVLGGYELISRCSEYSNESMISLARLGSDQISFCGVMKYIKLVFTYEFWEHYTLAVSHILPAIEAVSTPETPITAELQLYKSTIELLDAMKTVSANHQRRVTRPSTGFAESVPEGGASPTLDVVSLASGISERPSSTVAGLSKIPNFTSLIKLCDVISRIKKNDKSDLFVKTQSDMLVDGTLLILHKLKEHFSRLISTSTVKQYLIADNRDQLLHLLTQCHEFSLWLNLYTIDPLVPGEMALKAVLLMEASANKIESSIFNKFSIQEKSSRVQNTLADAIVILNESMRALEEVRSVKEISMRPDCDPAMLVVDPALGKCEGELPHSITVGDLQLEMVCVKQRLRFKLLKVQDNDPMKAFEWCNKNTLFQAVSHMQLATIDTKKAEMHLRESYTLLQKSWNEERRLLASLSGVDQVGAVPSPPILTSRTSTSMTFKPAPYLPPDGSKVKWYRLYGRSSSGSNIKVRLNDKLYPGLATEILAEPDAELTVSGLTPYEKYQFAVAAFDEHGRLIAGSIGSSSKPILASPPYCNLTAFGHLVQTCHKQGVLSVATEACAVLWNFFVMPQAASRTDISIPACNYPSLNAKHLAGATITVIRHLIESILVSVDIAIREGALFCDVTCDQGPLKSNQLARLGLCEKLLVAIELSGRINDTQLGTQAIIQTYGLLAPMIHHNIMCYPALKVLLYCHAALTELPGVVKQRKFAGNIQHMTGVITFYLSKTLHQWGECDAATLISENGHDLLLQFDTLYDELSEQSHAITPSNKKKPVKRPEPLPNVRKGNLKDMIQDPGGAPILKSDTLKSFETHVLRHNAIYPTNNNGEPEFTGQEDFNLLYTAVANLNSQQAQKEVYKFRRRSRFLELYVRVLEKALLECRPDLVVDWCGEASTWLTRRNELLIAPRPTLQTKETMKPAKLEALKNMALKGSDMSVLKKGDTKGPKTGKKDAIKTKPFKLWGPPDDNKLRAAELLRSLLPEVWRRSCKLQRLRLITHEEMPWRAQLNVILASACYMQFKDKLDGKVKAISETNLHDTVDDYDELPCDMFVVSDVGSMMYSAEEPEEEPFTDVPANLSLDLEREKTNLTNLFSKKGSISSVNSRQSKFGFSSDRAIKEIKMSYSSYLCHTFTSLSQALVLAHRGGHWALLWNISAHLWRTAMDLQMKMKVLSAQTKDMLGLTDQMITEILYKPMYYMSDFLLDYLENVIGSNEDIQDASMLMGKPQDIDGGSSLHFDKFDDTSYVHIRWLQRYVMETLKVLYHNCQFEKLSHIGIRFNLLTNDVFSDQTLPLIIYSKRKLADRVAEYNEPWHTETSSVSVRSTVTPVQAAGENVSPQIVEALRLVSVPLDHETDMESLKKVLSLRSHTAQSLQYCRQLLLCYLAGYGKGCNKASTSPVSSFHPGTAAANKLYDKPGDLFVSPLSSTSHGAIISTYEKTIEMLQVKGKSDLVVQAMHELGNVLFHSGNTKGAFKWWCDALDTLLHTSNAVQNWHSLTTENMLNKCQIWGCLLGACIASNISQYVVNHSIDDRVDSCLMSAQMFKALFCASLPHPNSDYEYATHEIGEGFNIPALIPGVDLLSDQFRCSASILVACLHYVAETLVRHQYALQALPVLTLYHYVAMSLCIDTKHLLLARVLKVQALCQLSMLSEALKLWSVISQNEALPIPPACHGNTISGKTENYIPVTALSLANVPVFDNTQPLNSFSNLKAVDHAIKSKLPPVTDAPFTSNLSALAQLAHATLLLSLANVTSVIPTYEPSENNQDSLAHTKYRLCNSAEVMLTQLSKSADKDDSHYCEIEAAVASYTLLCRISLQKQLGPITIALSNLGLTLLQRAYKLDRQEVISYDELSSKRRLDGFAWLQLKCCMIEGFSLMTTLYGANDCKQICADTLEEAHVFNSSETKSWLTLKDLVLELNNENAAAVERAVKDGLGKMVVPSCLGARVSMAAILYTATRATTESEALPRLRMIKELLKYQHEVYYGNKDNIHTYMSPVSALVVVLETDWKLKSISAQISGSRDSDEIIGQLTELESTLSSTLENSGINSAMRSELLIRLGVVMRSLWEHSPTPERLVALINILCDCVTSTNYNVSLAREAYLEIALVTSQQTLTSADSSKQVNLERRAAWSAIRTAALCNITSDSIKCLEQNPTSQNVVSGKELKKLPQFAGLELNRELASKLLNPNAKMSHPVPPVNLSWVKLLSYLETLKRDITTQGFSGYCPLTSPGLTSRVSQLHRYFSTNMPGWTNQCNIPAISRNISYLTVGRKQSTSPASSRESSCHSTDSQTADTAAEGGIVLQWFKPRLASKVQVSPSNLIMFYAFNLKAIKTSSPMFSSNSYTGFEVLSEQKVKSLHVQCEHAYTRVLIEDEMSKKQDNGGRTSVVAPTPASRASTKTSASPEPYRTNEIEQSLMDAIQSLLGLDNVLSKEAAELHETMSNTSLAVLENIFSQLSVPQYNVELCRWLMSFKKVIPRPVSEKPPSSRPPTVAASTPTSTPRGK